MDFNIANKDWGSADITITLHKIDLLPRFTLSEMRGISLMLNVGFLMFTFNLAIYDKHMRRFVKEVKEKGFDKMVEDIFSKIKVKKEDTSEDKSAIS
jgi:hypothetical protein